MTSGASGAGRRWLDRLRRLRPRRVVVVAPDRLWGELHAARLPSPDEDVIVLSGVADVPEPGDTPDAGD